MQRYHNDSFGNCHFIMDGFEHIKKIERKQWNNIDERSITVVYKRAVNTNEHIMLTSYYNDSIRKIDDIMNGTTDYIILH